jgi:outer membrane protein assembly factor BamA
VQAQADSSRSKKLLVLPVISRSIETGWSFGAAGSLTFRLSPKDSISRTSNLQVLALYSTKKQLVTAINGSQYFNNEKYILNEQFSFSSFPDKFWGLGNQTADEAEEPYKFNQFYIFLHLLRKISPHLFVGVVYEMQRLWNVEYMPGGLFDQQKIVGRNGYLVSGVGSSFTYDNRNNAFSPNKGFYGQLFINHFDKFWGSDYNYNNIVIDLRKYIPLSLNQSLAMQLYSYNTTGREVPIRSLASFGGASRMRGYYEGRYKEQQLLIIQSEYRFPVYKKFSGVAFAGWGDVSDQFANYQLSQFKYSFGAGIRFALDKKEKLNLRIDYGFGQGRNNGFYLQLGEAF